MEYRNKIIQGNSLDTLKLLPDESVDCIVTSPPYWNLRDYDMPGQMGLEKTVDEYIETMVRVFRECKRILKPAGTCWINIGDSYCGTGTGSAGMNSTLEGGKKTQDEAARRPTKKPGDNLKPKDLVGIPWTLAFALRVDGWYLRQDIIWNKPNPMPESVGDRCTKSHEYLFLLAKSREYYYDAWDIMQDAKPETGARYERGRSDDHKVINGSGGQKAHSFHQPKENIRKSGNKQRVPSSERGVPEDSGSDVCASVWTVPTRSFSEAHFATFPEKLIVDCIKAGTSEHGCCSQCGAPYERILEPSERYAAVLGSSYHDHSDDLARGMTQTNGTNMQNKMRDAGIPGAEYEFKGWQKTCQCTTDTIQPAVVLDPFMGAGTTALVSRKLYRDFVGTELNPEYIAIAERRLKKELGLFL